MDQTNQAFSVWRGSIKRFLWSRLAIPVRTIYGLPVSLLRHFGEKQSLGNVIDIGAHAGAFTAGLDRYVHISRGLLVEPQPEQTRWLKQLFAPPRFTVVEAAISEKTGQADFYQNVNGATSSLLPFARGIPELAAVNTEMVRTVQCRTLSMDDLAVATGFHGAELVKIDVQGAEHLVIRGGENVLRRTSNVWIEVSFKPLYETSSSFAEVYGLLGRAGFKLMELEPGFRAPDGELIQADALFSRI